MELEHSFDNDFEFNLYSDEDFEDLELEGFDLDEDEIDDQKTLLD